MLVDTPAAGALVPVGPSLPWPLEALAELLLAMMRSMAAPMALLALLAEGGPPAIDFALPHLLDGLGASAIDSIVLFWVPCGDSTVRRNALCITAREREPLWHRRDGAACVKWSTACYRT